MGQIEVLWGTHWDIAEHVRNTMILEHMFGFLYFSHVPNVFSSCFRRVLKFPNTFLKMFPIAPGFYPIWFAQSSTPCI